MLHEACGHLAKFDSRQDPHSRDSTFLKATLEEIFSF